MLVIKILLAKFILKIFPLRGHSTTIVQNTDVFMEIIRAQRLLDLDITVNCDIKSLFTNVPTNKTLEEVRTRLEKDSTLSQKTTLSINATREMLAT